MGFGIDAQRGAGFLVENMDCRGVFIPEDPTDEQRRIRRSASDFVDREVLPQVERLESLDLWESRPLMRKRGSLDLLAITYPLVDSAPIDTVGPSVGPKARSLSSITQAPRSRYGGSRCEGFRVGGRDCVR